MIALAAMYPSAAIYPLALDLARGQITGKLAGPEKKKQYKGIINTVLYTAREGGMRAIYKGVTPTLLGAMPYKGIKFGIHWSLLVGRHVRHVVVDD